MPANDAGSFDQPRSEVLEADRVEDLSNSEREETISWIRRQAATARPITGTPAERFLIEHGAYVRLGQVRFAGPRVIRVIQV